MKLNKPTRKIIAFAVLTMGVSTASNAAVINTFTNITDFTNAAGALILEDFNSSTQQRFTLNTAYQFNGFTVTALPHQGGGTGPGAGISDTTRSDIDGTARLVWGRETFGPNNGGWGPQIVFTFDAPTYAFGFDWRNTDPTDSYKLVVLGEDLGAGNTEVPWPRPRSLPGSPSQASGFFGLVSDTAFTTITLQQVARGGVLNDMSMDNVRLTQTSSSVPEPASLALLGLGLAGLGFARRRRIH